MPTAHPSRPATAERIETYRQLADVADAWAAGHLAAALVISEAGLGKTETIRKVVSGRGCIINGRASGFELYRQIALHVDEPLVLDDVELLSGDPQKLALLKGLLETSEVKTVSWRTLAAKREGLPDEVQTRSRVVLLANHWNATNPDAAAVESRTHVYAFEPSNLQVHVQSSGFFWDQEIHDFVGERLCLFPRLTLRHYVLAWEKKRAGLAGGVGWRDYLISRCLTGNKLIAAQIRADPAFGTDAARVEAFLARTGLRSKQSYYDAVRGLPESAPAPRMLLNNRPPCQPPTMRDGIADILNDRHKFLGNG